MVPGGYSLFNDHIEREMIEFSLIKLILKCLYESENGAIAWAALLKGIS